MACSCKNTGRVVFVQQHCTNRIFSNSADAMGQQQPSLVDLDGWSAIANLHKLPRVFRFEQKLAVAPIAEIVGFNNE